MAPTTPVHIEKDIMDITEDQILGMIKDLGDFKDLVLQVRGPHNKDGVHINSFFKRRIVPTLVQNTEMDCRDLLKIIDIPNLTILDTFSDGLGICLGDDKADDNQVGITCPRCGDKYISSNVCTSFNYCVVTGKELYDEDQSDKVVNQKITEFLS